MESGNTSLNQVVEIKAIVEDRKKTASHCSNYSLSIKELNLG